MKQRLRHQPRVMRDAERAAVTLAAALLVMAATACTSVRVETSPNDPRAYRYVELDDGLQVLLISDPAADKAAAALTVFRGSYDEPAARAGLAHFLEHMLFLGTARYPLVDEYQTFITKHGGSNNAYTAADHTNYFFDIDPVQLEAGLDRFADFFVAPLFDAQYVEREKNAVNSEYQMQLRDDGWRGITVTKVTFDPRYPGSRFTIGSLDTLAGDVRADLIRFFDTQYSADEMGLVVLGREALDVLESWVRPRFGAIRKRPAVATLRPGPVFAPGSLPLELTYRTIKDGHSIAFNFPVPSPDQYYEAKPLDYIGDLIGHEGEGSLHSLLKSRGWIESLGAGGSRLDSDNGIVAVSIELTDEGAKHTDEITVALFRYLDLIAQSGIERWRFDEQARIAELAFRFKEESGALRYVSGLAPNMRLYPPRDLLVAPYRMTRFDAGLIRRFLSELRGDNMMVEVAGPDVATDKVEPWFQVPYSLARATTPTGAPGLDLTTLMLPARNPFVPENIALIGEVEEPPELAVQAPGLSVWTASDTSFRVPRATLYVRIDVMDGLRTPHDVAAAHLYARLVRDRLNTYAYSAEIAGLDYAVTPDNSGFLIAISGYDDKQPELLEKILDALVALPIEESRVAIYRGELAKDWSNFKTERPYAQTFARLDQLLLSTSWSPERLGAELPSVDAAVLEAWRRERFVGVHATALQHGNVSRADTEAVAGLLRDRLHLAGAPVPDPEVVHLATEPLVLATDIAHDDAAITLYVQGETEGLHERALFGLAAQMVRSPYFTDLRTEQQLGYAVIATPAPIRRLPGLAFLVQSPVAGPTALVTATEQFLTGYRATLAAMSQQEFDAHRQGLVTRLLERDKSLFERSQRYWADLELGFTHFDSREQIAREVASITRDEFAAFYDRLVTLATKDRLVVYSTGKFDGVPAGRDLGTTDAFKKAPPPPV